MSASLRGLLVLIGIIAVVGFACVFLPFFAMPQSGLGVALPVITLPGEAIVPNWPVFGYDFLNTMTSLVLVDVIVLIIAVVVGRAMRSAPPDRFVPRGLTNFIELLGEFLYNQAYNLLGARWARAVFPLAASIFVFILISNWVKLVPGYETVGLTVCAEYNVFAPETDKLASGQLGYPVNGLVDGKPAGVMSLNNSGGDLKARAGVKATRADTLKCEEEHPWAKPPLAQAIEERAVAAKLEEVKKKEPTLSGEELEKKKHEIEEEYHAKLVEKAGGKEAVEAGNANLFTIAPFFRGVTTDLNFPLALAVIVVVIVQVWGIQALGLAYFFKFINLPALGKLGKKPLGAIDFIVGLIEIISELSRLLSLTFRLFGAVFAGGVLLIVFSFLMAFIVPIPVYFLELFIGGIQAYVFAMLTFIYASQAVVSHHDDDHGHAEGHAEHAH